MEEAEALLRECMQSHPECAVAYNNLALLLVARARSHWGEAGRVLEQAREGARASAAGAVHLPHVEPNQRLLEQLLVRGVGD